MWILIGSKRYNTDKIKHYLPSATGKDPCIVIIYDRGKEDYIKFENSNFELAKKARDEFLKQMDWNINVQTIIKNHYEQE